jgi:hypothetical protein
LQDSRFPGTYDFEHGIVPNQEGSGAAAGTVPGEEALQGVDRSRRSVEGSTVMAGWLMVSLTKYSISDTEPHKRTDREEFSPSEAGFHGDCSETRLGVGMGVRMGT